MNSIGKYWKAVVAFVGPGAVVLGSSLAAGSDGGSKITQVEWLTAAIACVVTSAGVYAVKNKQAE